MSINFPSVIVYLLSMVHLVSATVTFKRILDGFYHPLDGPRHFGLSPPGDIPMVSMDVCSTPDQKKESAYFIGVDH